MLCSGVARAHNPPVAMPRRAAREEPREGTLDMLMSRSSAVRKRLGNVEKVSIEYIEASGDCFYLAMEAALSEGEGWCLYYGVATMRDVVASAMTGRRVADCNQKPRAVEARSVERFVTLSVQ